MGQDELINAMSDEDIAEMKEKYADNASVILLLDGILETRRKVATQAKAKADYVKGITTLVGKHLAIQPEGETNVLITWEEADIADGEPEEVMVNGTTELRTPHHKEVKPVVRTNVFWSETTSVNRSASGKGNNGVSKRAIRVFKRSGTQLIDKGVYASATKACEALGLIVGGDSATRVLARDGYISEPATS